MTQLYFLINVGRKVKFIIQILSYFFFVDVSEVNTFFELLQIQNQIKILPSQQNLDCIRTIGRTHYGVNDPQNGTHSHLIVVLLHIVKNLSQALQDRFWVNNIIISQVNAIFSFFEDIVEIVLIRRLQFLCTVDLKVTFTNFFADGPPKHVALSVLLEWQSDLLVLRLLFIRPTDNWAFLLTEIVLQFKVAPHKDLVRVLVLYFQIMKCIILVIFISAKLNIAFGNFFVLMRCFVCNCKNKHSTFKFVRG